MTEATRPVSVRVHVHPSMCLISWKALTQQVRYPGVSALQHPETSRQDCSLGVLLRLGPTTLLEAGLSLPENILSTLLGPHQILLPHLPLTRQPPPRPHKD